MSNEIFIFFVQTIPYNFNFPGSSKLLNLPNLVRLRNGKVQARKFKSFLKQTSESFINTFCRKWEGETRPKWFFIYKSLEKCQKEYYPDNQNSISFCRCTSLHVLMFPVSLPKQNLWSYWKWQTFEEKIWPFFMTTKNKDFLNDTFVSYMLDKEVFFSRIYISL